MKRIITIILFLCVSTTIAQNATAQQNQYGIKAGFTAYNMDFESTAGINTSDLLLGWTIGVYAQVPISPQFSFQPELMFIQKGGQGSEGGATNKIVLNYIDVPLMLRFDIPLDTEVRPYLIGGPTLGYLAGGNLEIEAGNSSISGDIKDLFTDFNVGLSAGLGLALRQFSIDYRYEFGLMNIWDVDNSGDTTAKTSGFTVALGYSF